MARAQYNRQISRIKRQLERERIPHRRQRAWRQGGAGGAMQTEVDLLGIPLSAGAEIFVAAPADGATIYWSVTDGTVTLDGPVEYAADRCPHVIDRTIGYWQGWRHRRDV